MPTGHQRLLLNFMLPIEIFLVTFGATKKSLSFVAGGKFFVAVRELAIIFGEMNFTLKHSMPRICYGDVL